MPGTETIDSNTNEAIRSTPLVRYGVSVLLAVGLVLLSMTYMLPRPALAELPPPTAVLWLPHEAVSFEDETPSPESMPGRVVDQGSASFYGNEFAGSRTANGESFDPNALTAAHPSLPMGSTVRVTNEHNGRSVVVRINDRGPFAKNRVIDLSKRAARDLGFVQRGTAPVTVELLPVERS